MKPLKYIKLSASIDFSIEMSLRTSKRIRKLSINFSIESYKYFMLNNNSGNKDFTRPY